MNALDLCELFLRNADADLAARPDSRAARAGVVAYGNARLAVQIADRDRTHAEAIFRAALGQVRTQADYANVGEISRRAGFRDLSA